MKSLALWTQCSRPSWSCCHAWSFLVFPIKTFFYCIYLFLLDSQMYSIAIPLNYLLAPWLAELPPLIKIHQRTIPSTPRCRLWVVAAVTVGQSHHIMLAFEQTCTYFFNIWLQKGLNCGITWLDTSWFWAHWIETWRVSSISMQPWNGHVLQGNSLQCAAENAEQSRFKILKCNLSVKFVSALRLSLWSSLV